MGTSRSILPPLIVEELEDFGDCKNELAQARSPRKLQGAPLPMLNKDAKFIPSQCPPPVTDFSLACPPKKLTFNVPELNRDIKTKPKRLNYVWSADEASKEGMLKELRGYHANKGTQMECRDQKSRMEEIALTVGDVIKRIEQLKVELEKQEEEVKKREQLQKKQQPAPKVRRDILQGSYPNLTVKDESHLPNLLRFSWKGKVEKLEAYLRNPKNKSKINFQVDSNGRTALHFAASWADERIVWILVRVPGINLDLQDSHGMTPLFKAVQIHSLDCTKTLVEAGSDPSISCKDGRNVLEYAIMEYGDTALDCIRYLYSLHQLHKVHSKVHGKFTELTLLHQACLSRADNVDRTLLMLIESIDQRDLDTPEGGGLTPLFVAVVQDRLSLVKILVENGADITIRDKNNNTARYYAKSIP